MKNIKHVTLRDGETAVCDCCGAQLKKRAVTGAVGCVGEDCWETIKDLAGFVRYQHNNPNSRILSAIELRALPFAQRCFQPLI